MTYRQAIAEGKRMYDEAMDKAAVYVLYVADEFDRPLQAVCKDVAGDGWAALRSRANRLKAKGAGQGADARVRARQQARDGTRRSVNALAQDQDEAANLASRLSPTALANLHHETGLVLAGRDRTPAGRSAARARGEQAVAPMRRAVATTSMVLAIEAQKDATANLRDALDNDAVTPAQFDRFERAHAEAAEVMAEIRFKLPAREGSSR